MKHRLFSLALLFAACTPFAQAAEPAKVSGTASAPASATATTTAAAIGKTLVQTDSVVGKGAEAGLGSVVEVHYTGWLYDPNAVDAHGQKFDSSVGRDTFRFQVGAKQVIKGWDQGLQGMKVGGKRTLIIPSELGYGKRGAGGVIPPDAILVFDIELISVK
jgi:FKBP-type peptidyl-prolyl cis-trans isomerase FkpA